MSKPDFEKMALSCHRGSLDGMGVESALRSAYRAGLDRAGHIAHNHGWYSMGYVEDEPPPDVITHNHACWAIRDAIRAEREKS